MFNTAKKAGENYTNAQNKELADLEKLYSEIKIATNEDSQITISIEDLNKLIEDKVKQEVSNTKSSEYVELASTNSTSKINMKLSDVLSNYRYVMLVARTESTFYGNAIISVEFFKQIEGDLSFPVQSGIHVYACYKDDENCEIYTSNGGYESVLYGIK